VLNTDGRFALPAMFPAATPIVSILFLRWFADSWGVYALAAGSLVGAVLETTLLGAMMLYRGFAIRPRWFGRTLALDQVLAQYWPVVGGVWLLGGAPLIDQSIAAMLGSGSVAALQYGTRLTVVLSAVGPGAVATAILPHFSTLIVTQDGADIRRSLRSYAFIILAVTIPVIAVLMWFSEPLARLFFQRGNFTGAATGVVASVQRFALLQIPFAMIMALVLRMISSMKANRLLLGAAILAAVLNLGLDLVFIRWMGVAGIALASAVVQATSLAYLVFVIRKRLPASLQSPPRTEAVVR
jgi:putative peptidoglycan lipid II flippase